MTDFYGASAFVSFALRTGVGCFVAMLQGQLQFEFRTIAGFGYDGAGYFPLAVDHRKQHDHPIKFIAEKVTACERHLTYSFKGQAILQDPDARSRISAGQLVALRLSTPRASLR
jgi:hypothetical protein